MTKEAISKLRTTDLVRRGRTQGIVVSATPETVKICWDDQGNTPTSYSRQTNALDDVSIERKGDTLSFTDPVSHRFRVRRR